MKRTIIFLFLVCVSASLGAVDRQTTAANVPTTPEKPSVEASWPVEDRPLVTFEQSPSAQRLAAVEHNADASKAQLALDNLAAAREEYARGGKKEDFLVQLAVIDRSVGGYDAIARAVEEGRELDEWAVAVQLEQKLTAQKQQALSGDTVVAPVPFTLSDADDDRTNADLERIAAQGSDHFEFSRPATPVAAVNSNPLAALKAARDVYAKSKDLGDYIDTLSMIAQLNAVDVSINGDSVAEDVHAFANNLEARLRPAARDRAPRTVGDGEVLRPKHAKDEIYTDILAERLALARRSDTPAEVLKGHVDVDGKKVNFLLDQEAWQLFKAAPAPSAPTTKVKWTVIRPQAIGSGEHVTYGFKGLEKLNAAQREAILNFATSDEQTFVEECERQHLRVVLPKAGLLDDSEKIEQKKKSIRWALKKELMVIESEEAAARAAEVATAPLTSVAAIEPKGPWAGSTMEQGKHMYANAHAGQHALFPAATAKKERPPFELAPGFDALPPVVHPVQNFGNADQNSFNDAQVAAVASSQTTPIDPAESVTPPASPTTITAPALTGGGAGNGTGTPKAGSESKDYSNWELGGGAAGLALATALFKSVSPAGRGALLNRLTSRVRSDKRLTRAEKWEAARMLGAAVLAAAGTVAVVDGVRRKATA